MDGAWSFCPMCGADNRPPNARSPVPGCNHLQFHGASFCPSCGQPLAAVGPPASDPAIPAPQPPATVIVKDFDFKRVVKLFIPQSEVARVAIWLFLLLVLSLSAMKCAGIAEPWIERTWPDGVNP